MLPALLAFLQEILRRITQTLQCILTCKIEIFSHRDYWQMHVHCTTSVHWIERNDVNRDRDTILSIKLKISNTECWNETWHGQSRPHPLQFQHWPQIKKISPDPPTDTMVHPKGGQHEPCHQISLLPLAPLSSSLSWWRCCIWATILLCQNCSRRAIQLSQVLSQAHSLCQSCQLQSNWKQHYQNSRHHHRSIHKQFVFYLWSASNLLYNQGRSA